MPTAAYRALYTIAEGQMGYITTLQAAAVGVRPMTLVMMRRRGALERVSRGVYRLLTFPAQPLGRFMRASLWPYEQHGVVSHGTALFLHELSEFDPAQMHITVPANFRIQRHVPQDLALHRQHLAPGDVERLKGIWITTPAKTIRDCIAAKLEQGGLEEGIRRAVQKGLLDSADADELATRVSQAVRETGDRRDYAAASSPRVGAISADLEARSS